MVVKIAQNTFEKSASGFDRIKILTLYEKGALMHGCQRIDLDVYPAVEIYSDKFSIKIGITDRPGDDFNKVNEKPTSFRTSHISHIDELIIGIIKSKVRLCKLRGTYRQEMINLDLGLVYRAYKEENQ